jgi:hypothetical protein
LLHTLAVALGYAPERQHYQWADADWFGFERALGGAWRLRIGYSQSPKVGLWLSDRQQQPWFGELPEEQPATTATELRALIDRLWNRWNTE